MKKEQIFELMNAVPPDLVEEADTQAPVKRRFSKGVRGALIAACLCLALVGTTFAAVTGIRALQLVHMEPHIDGKGVFDGYTVSGDLETYRLRDFSEAFHEAGKTKDGRVDMEFPTFEEARAYLGKNIPCIWPNDWEGKFIVSLFHDRDGEIWGSEVISRDPGDHTEIRMRVLTEKSDQKENDEKILGMYGGYGEKKRLEHYEMPNGLVAETYIESASAETSRCSCVSFFISNGNIYEVSTYDSSEHQDELWPRIQAVLDRFP